MLRCKKAKKTEERRDHKVLKRRKRETQRDRKTEIEIKRYREKNILVCLGPRRQRKKQKKGGIAKF